MTRSGQDQIGMTVLPLLMGENHKPRLIGTVSIRLCRCESAGIPSQHGVASATVSRGHRHPDMDQKRIKTLIDAMSSSDLAEMEFREDGWTLRLVRGAAHVGASHASPVSTIPSRTRRDIPAAKSRVAAESDVVSPMFGVFYLRPSPDAPEFVTPGSAVKVGMTLCVVEAMKVFNEIKAPRDGVVESILATSGDEVEAGQSLMTLA